MYACIHLPPSCQLAHTLTHSAHTRTRTHLHTRTLARYRYGVSYMLVEECLFFHVTSKRSADNTSSERFAGHIFRALRDIGALADRVNSAAGGGRKAGADADKKKAK